MAQICYNCRMKKRKVEQLETEKEVVPVNELLDEYSKKDMISNEDLAEISIIDDESEQRKVLSVKIAVYFDGEKKKIRKEGATTRRESPEIGFA